MKQDKTELEQMKQRRKDIQALIHESYKAGHMRKVEKLSKEMEQLDSKIYEIKAAKSVSS